MGMKCLVDFQLCNNKLCLNATHFVHSIRDGNPYFLVLNFFVLDGF